MISKKKKRKVFTKIESDFSAEIRNSKVVSAHKKVISKKEKKKKRSSPKLRVIFRPKSEIFSVFFRPKSSDLHKKKRSSPISRLIFRPISQIQSSEGGLFSNGGAIFYFSQKIGLKSTKNMQFAYFTSQWGGLEPPPPPLATLLFASFMLLHESENR